MFFGTKLNKCISSRIKTSNKTLYVTSPSIWRPLGDCLSLSYRPDLVNVSIRHNSVRLHANTSVDDDIAVCIRAVDWRMWLWRFCCRRRVMSVGNVNLPQPAGFNLTTNHLKWWDVMFCGQTAAAAVLRRERRIVGLKNRRMVTGQSPLRAAGWGGQR